MLNKRMPMPEFHSLDHTVNENIKPVPEQPEVDFDTLVQEAGRSVADSIMQGGFSKIEFEVETAMNDAVTWHDQNREWEAHQAKLASAKKKPTKKAKVTVKKTVKRNVKKSKKK